MKKTYNILLSFFLILISGFGFSQSVPSYVPTNGLVGWWEFNGNAQDGSGNGNHGIPGIGISSTTDRYNNNSAAFIFNGSGHIPISTIPTTGAQDFTISTWIKTNNNTITKGIACWGQDSPWAGVYFFITNSGHLKFDFAYNGGPQSSSFIADNQWHHVSVTCLNGYIQLFLDGLSTSTALQMFPSIIGSTRALGACIVNSGNNNFIGSLDDIGIWNRALSQQEIANLYNSQSAITIPTINSCLGDTSSVTISHPTLTGVANASLRLTYNPDSLTYLGFNSLNPAFNGMAINGTNGVIAMDWNTSSNQTIAAGNLVNLRFRVNGNSNLTWDTLIVPSEFYDSAYNLVPQTFSSGSVNHRTTRLTWNRNICEGQSFTLGNQSYTTSGTYQGRRFGSGGACDTLIILNLNVLPRQTNPLVNICSNQMFSFNGLQLSSSGVYLDTLVNFLGCDSIVQLNLTVNPVYAQNLTMTICAGGSLQFGSQNLTVAGNYTNTFVSSRGCDSLVNLSLNVSNSTTIVSSNGQNGFCPNGSVRIGLANPQSNATYTWRKDGAIIANATSDTLSVNQTGNYQLAVQVSPTCIIQSNTLTIGVLNCNRITGDLRYDNNNQTPLAGIPVHLKSLLGNIVASDTTDSSGSYDMAGYANGNYLLDAAINYTYGGVNSTDALQVTRFFTSLVTLSPLRIKVGDVNGSGITNSGDALLINRRITGLITSFSVGNFVNNLPSVNALGNPLVANLRALSTGDVNGTYNPQPTAPILVLDTVIAGFGSGTATVRFTSTGSGVFERGICWGTLPNPTVSENKMVVGSGGYGFTQIFSGGMVGNQLYYVRAYAKNSLGISYSSEKTFTTPPGQPCSGVSTVTDIDGNVYQGIQIGTQCWMQSNLKVSKYRNGDNIPTGLSNSVWGNTGSGAYAIYNNDPVNEGLYGKLYNHYAVTDSRGLCPTGWHVPTDGEWNTLANHLGGYGVAGGALKGTAMQPAPGGWNLPNAGATNSCGFTALPGGLRHYPGSFINIKFIGGWWSSSVSSASLAWHLTTYYNNILIYRDTLNRAGGFSVRCLKDSVLGGVSASVSTVTTTSVTSITSTGATTGGNVTSDGGASVTARGVAYGTAQNPTTSNSTTSNGTGTGVFISALTGLSASTLYYVRAYATNSIGTGYGSQVSFTTSAAAPSFTCGTSTVSDVDNNTYNTVQIGTQCWTQSNLKVSKYRNGVSISTGLSNSAWSATTSGAYAMYNNDPVNDVVYGKLYNHYAVTDSRGLCPTGWHVPSDAEWNILVKFLDPSADTVCSICSQSGIAGGALKSTSMQPNPGGWNSPNFGATNSSGFTALPGGLRWGYNGDFGKLSDNGYWWSSTVSSGSNAWFRVLDFNGSEVYRINEFRTYGFSVRCLKD